jgi:predicted aspartyl protease
MIFGRVDERYEATVRLVVGDFGTRRQTIAAIIDTGFTGFLRKPPSHLKYPTDPDPQQSPIASILDVYRDGRSW